MCIVTGPRIDLAIALIDRMKKLFAISSKGLIIIPASFNRILTKRCASLEFQK
jgi:hypothetical protein